MGLHIFEASIILLGVAAASVCQLRKRAMMRPHAQAANVGAREHTALDARQIVESLMASRASPAQTPVAEVT